MKDRKQIEIPKMMRVVRFKAGVPIEQEAAEMEMIPVPEAHGYDLLVKVEAVSLNPVDTKVRPKAGEEDKVLGYDAAGTVVAGGGQVIGFSLGDRVYYAGDIRRPGSNSEYQLVDSRIVGRAPESLSLKDAAALPLTTLTACEALFTRLGIDYQNKNDQGKTILIIGGAGGVGSMGIQLAKWAGLRVYATASREESCEWCKKLGADGVVNHFGDMVAELKELGISELDYIANFNDVDDYWQIMGELIAPQGKIVLVVDPRGDLNLGGEYKRKSATIAWEFMFTRSMFETEDMARQGQILDRVANWVDRGGIHTTIGKVVGKINAENLIDAHRQISSGHTIGKLVLAGWE